MVSKIFISNARTILLYLFLLKLHRDVKIMQNEKINETVQRSCRRNLVNGPSYRYVRLH